ncbi:MAG TPA: multicopper oxidase domain-containing protein [Candidatus Angelobacter sp.]|nr:multicopper oxidase domain-containing protein [Candidatus Angelobacter sp.]
METVENPNLVTPERQQPTRREFLRLTLCTASGLALWQLAPEAWAQCATQNVPLTPVGEIVSSGGFLQGIIDTQVVKRSITYFNVSAFACETDHMLRCYQGYHGYNLNPSNAVIKNMAMSGPGPTLRVGIGETIEVIFLNRIDPDLLPATAVTSQAGHCDTSTNASTGQQVYPGKDASYYPNCFHASNTTNLHWHGTHTSPSGFGDNVFLGILPDARLDTASTIARLQKAFTTWNNGGDPGAELIAAGAASLNAMYKAAETSGNTTLATQLKTAIETNQRDIAAGEFPQFWVGAFPYRVELPKWSGSPTKYPRMGQAPGTHWYHCHQHGSTALQILNGMAGAIIITDNSADGYDGRMSKLGYKEQVMILQLYSEQPNRVNASPSASQVAVNGQIIPTITMKQGEVQWWRMVDATQKAHGIENFFFLSDAQLQKYISSGTKLGGALPAIQPGPMPSLNQCAQDGVQFKWDSFQRFRNAPDFKMAPGNRCDFLVQAPTNKTGVSWLVFWPPVGPPPIAPQSAVVLKVNVTSETSNQQLPTQAQYPTQPEFLNDITDEEIHGHKQQVDFSMKGSIGDPPFFFIDGKQFQEGVIDRVMLKDSAEEWTLRNTSLSGISHPFHIHINPFQVTEVYDPNTMLPPAGQNPDPARDAQKLEAPWVWHDVISIPAGKEVTINGQQVVIPGHIKMRSRFDDFYGKFVVHCHILGHEDRGMMQVVEVVNNTTVIKHH